jgi:hypothetical protein
MAFPVFHVVDAFVLAAEAAAVAEVAIGGEGGPA